MLNDNAKTALWGPDENIFSPRLKASAKKHQSLQHESQVIEESTTREKKNWYID